MIYVVYIVYIYIYIYIVVRNARVPCGPMTLCACVDALMSPCCTACVW